MSWPSSEKRTSKDCLVELQTITEESSANHTHTNSWGRLAAALGQRGSGEEGTAQAITLSSHCLLGQEPGPGDDGGAGEGQKAPDQQEPAGSGRERVVGSKRAQPFFWFIFGPPPPATAGTEPLSALALLR